MAAHRRHRSSRQRRLPLYHRPQEELDRHDRRQKGRPGTHRGAPAGSPYIAQVVCVGERRPYITALIVPNFENLEAYFKERGLRGMNREQMSQHQLTRALVEAAVKQANADLATFERIRRAEGLANDFSLEHGEITPKLNVRRNVIVEHYQSVIDEMYLKTHRPGEYGLDEQEVVASRQ